MPALVTTGRFLALCYVALTGAPVDSAAERTTAVDARIEIVWPHNQAGEVRPADRAPFVNVEVYLFERETNRPVACSFPNAVMLRWARNERDRVPRFLPARDGVSGTHVIREVGGVQFPVWVFNDVPTGLSKTSPLFNAPPSFNFFVDVQGADTRSNVWVHDVQPSPFLPPPRSHEVLPEGTQPLGLNASFEYLQPGSIEEPLPIFEAPYADIGLALIDPTSLLSVPAEFDANVRLLAAVNNEPLEPVRLADEFVMMSSQLFDGTTRAWPVWVFSHVDVAAAQDSSNVIRFAARVEGVETYTTIWSYGRRDADARSKLPQPEAITASCAD